MYATPRQARVAIGVIGCAVLLSAGVPAVVAASVTGKHPPKRVCHRGKAVAANDLARLYKRLQSDVLQLYGCANPAGRQVFLGTVDPDPDVNPGYVRYALAGRFAVLATGYIDNRSGRSGASVSLTDLRTRRFLRPTYGVAITNPYILKIVADSGPQAAWIEADFTGAGPIRVVAEDRHGVHLLDSRPDVVPSSLRLVKGIVRWRAGNEDRTATLVGAIRSALAAPSSH